jgi:hypothetical protein
MASTDDGRSSFRIRGFRATRGSTTVIAHVVRANAMSMRFVADGCERARAALRSEIRREVAAKYAARLAGAPRIKRIALRRAMKAEIEQRVAAKAPFDALY